MANDFKRICTPNISNSSNSTIYAVPAGSGSAALESIVIGISVCNKNASERTVGLFLDNFDGSNDGYIVNGLKIPGNTTVELMSGNKIVLQNSGSAGDVLRAEASAGSSIDVVLSVLEDV